MHKSIWRNKIELPEYDSLKGEVSADVTIIGGGICGILCAHFLKQAGIKCVVVEANKIASGVTENTTAKITSLHGLVYSDIIRQYGKELAQMYLRANEDAILEYRKLCKNIDCDFETKDAYTYSVGDRDKIEQEVDAVKAIGAKAEFTDKTELPFRIAGAVKFENQAQFNPLKFIKEIVYGIDIYENSFIREITPHFVISDKGRIKTNKIIVATHFPFINKHGSYFIKLYQHRSYVSAYENAAEINGMYVDEDKSGMSFRSYKNLLLIGGGGHRTGKQGEAWSGIERFTKVYYPNSSLRYIWAAQDCMSLDSIPYIGKYSKQTKDMYVATGFNKWGMTSAMAAAKILCDMVQGKMNEYEEVFSPHRSIIKPQLAINGFESVVNLLTPSLKRCPHLGCALKWNKAEHTWDCPCHGSRFEKDGKLINNPATGDAKVN